jgi:hypothetical protein
MIKNLIFSSVGDFSNFPHWWLNKKSLKEFDIYVCYYGNNMVKAREFEKHCDYFTISKGSKFQNFYKIFNRDKITLDKYDAFWIVDDDIQINTLEINKLFLYQKRYNTWILQPSFTDGAISHDITKCFSENKIRFTNFIEVCVPLFSKYALYKCMEIYDPILVGWGIDYLFIWYLGEYEKDKYAIVDEIQCVNPFFENRKREIEILQPEIKRRRAWNKIKRKYNIRETNHTNFKVIKRFPIYNK